MATPDNRSKQIQLLRRLAWKSYEGQIEQTYTECISRHYVVFTAKHE